MSECFAYMYICAPCACSVHRSEKGIEASGTGATDGYEPPRGEMETESGPLQEPQVFSTTEPARLCFQV